jgi:putative Holliday junction resolvase
MQKRFLGVDLGSKRIGLSVSDPLNIISQRFTTINYKGIDDLSNELNKIIIEKNIGTIVFGLPETLSGKESIKTLEVKKIVEKLRSKIDSEINFIFEDEALTTIEAYEIMEEMGINKKKYKELVDQIAAQRILESYMKKLIK